MSQGGGKATVSLTGSFSDLARLALFPLGIHWRKTPHPETENLWTLNGQLASTAPVEMWQQVHPSATA